MSKPLVCSVYHIATPRMDVSVDELKILPSLPSAIIADNSLFYGEYEIIGNLPIADGEDYPVMYGNSIRFDETAVCYQCGKVYRKIENSTALFTGFKYNGVSFILNFTLDVLRRCIKEGSNKPYWENYYNHWVEQDLRNPKNAEKLKRIKIVPPLPKRGYNLLYPHKLTNLPLYAIIPKEISVSRRNDYENAQKEQFRAPDGCLQRLADHGACRFAGKLALFKAGLLCPLGGGWLRQGQIHR